MTPQCGDRVRIKDGETGQVIEVNSCVVGYGEHGRPVVETFIRVRLDVPSLTPVTTYVDPSEILEVLR